MSVIVGLVMVVGALSVGVAAGEIQEDTSPSRTGEEVYGAACAACHGADGRGTAATKADYPLTPPGFTDCDFATREPVTDWQVVTRHGGPARAFSRLMPAFGEALSPEELQLAVSYALTFCDDDAWPRGDLNFPRALVTTKAFPEDELVLTVIADEGAVTNKVVYEWRVGPRSQIELIAPLTLSAHTPGDWTGGGGDLGFAFKRTMAANNRRGTIVSAAAELVVPTGSTERGLGSGTTVVEPFVAIGQRLPARTFLQLQVGGALPFDRTRPDEAFWRAVVGQQHAAGRYRRTWAPMVEILGRGR